MSESSSPACSVQQQCKAVEPQEKSMNATQYAEESGHMKLHAAVEYFGLMVAVVFRVIEGTYNSKGREAVAKGDMFIACLKKAASFLKLKSGSACVTVPVVTRTEFALTPLSEEDNETDAAVRSWEGVYHSVAEFFEARRDQDMPMPAALKVLDYALDHSKKKVPPKTLLFNIRPVSQMVGLRKRCGIEGVDSTGAVHRFLEGEDPLYFSTRLFDVKCSPMCFLKALHLPQTARVYRHPDMEQEDEGMRSLQNLSIVTITEVSHDHHLVVRKLSDDGNQLSPTFTVPLSADLKVVAVKLKDSQLLGRISDKRHVAKYKPKVEATKEDNCARPLPPTPEEELAATPPDEEGLYEIPGKLQDCMGQTTDSTPPTVTELTEVEENTGADPTMPSTPETTIPESNADTSTDDNGYSRVGTASLPAPEGGHDISHGVSDVAAQQVRLERLGDSLASEQGLSLPNKAVQRPLVRHNTAPLHRPPSPSARRRHTICKGSVNGSTASCPKEPELRFHVAARLGLDWRSVCSYLGLQHYQLDQAHEAHAKLEEKAMEALVMWLQGQGDSEAPRSWSTLLQALHKREVTLKVESSPGNDPVTVSGTSFTEFALTPPDEDVTETDIANWEGLYSSIPKFLEATKRNRWGMPAALKVLNEAVDHNKWQVPVQTILFNIRKISRKVGLMQKVKSGIEGVDCSGTVHQFLEDEDPLFFSTRLYDVKCIPLYFTEVVQFPQQARVYRHSNTEEGEEEDSLENLSTITIAEVTRGNRLVVRKLDSRDQLGPNFTVPLDANVKVAAIRLQQGHLLDRVSDQRCMKKSMSCPNLARIACQGDTFMNAHFEDHCEVARDGVQAGRQRDHDLEVCYSVDTLKLKQHRRDGNVAGAVDIPMSGTSDRLHVMMTDTDSDDDSDCEYMEDRMLTCAHQGRKVPLSCPGSLLQGHQKKRKPSACVEASLGYSPLAQARKEDTHFLPCSASQKFRSMRCRDTDARPTELELFHHVARRLGADWKRFAIYLGFEDVRIQQADSMQSFEQKANDILVAWLKGSGNKRKSWATILVALETAELNELAREIEGHIEGGTMYCSASTSQVRWL